MPKRTALDPLSTYHVCSRGNNREGIFHTDHDRRRFLDLYAEHVAPKADTYAYCLMPNHFHLPLRFREEDVDPTGKAIAPPSRHLSNMLNAYARTFNRDHSRVGALFQRPFRRVLVKTRAQVVQVVLYIHLNPCRHGLVEDFRRWHYSSFAALRSSGPTQLARDEVLAWFGGRVNFVRAHLSASDVIPDDKLTLDPETVDTT